VDEDLVESDVDLGAVEEELRDHPRLAEIRPGWFMLARR
jgi:hypothetical protein